MLGRRCWELEMKMQEKGVWKSTKRKRERLKGAIIKVRRRSKSSLEGKKNEDVNGNRKLFWKEVSKVNGAMG